MGQEEDEEEKSKVEIVGEMESNEMGEGPGVRWARVECSANAVEVGREVWKKGGEKGNGGGGEAEEEEYDVGERWILVW